MLTHANFTDRLYMYIHKTVYAKPPENLQIEYSVEWPTLLLHLSLYIYIYICTYYTYIYKCLFVYICSGLIQICIYIYVSFCIYIYVVVLSKYVYIYTYVQGQLLCILLSYIVRLKSFCELSFLEQRIDHRPWFPSPMK